MYIKGRLDPELVVKDVNHKQYLILTGSNIANWLPILLPGTTPAPPTNPAATLPMILPYRLGTTRTSNC